MKLLPRTPLLVLGAILLLSVVALMRGTPTPTPTCTPSDKNKLLHLNMHCWNFECLAAWNKFNTALGNSKADAYDVDYTEDNGTPHHADKGKLKNKCGDCDRKADKAVNPNTTKQVSFLNSTDMADFLKNAF